MGKIAIEAKNLSKVFKLPHQVSNSFKESLVRLLRPNRYEDFEALKGVNFQIKQGEFVSFIGPNGGGKSTLLKIITGIYRPTHGCIKVNGEISPFLELGVGFNGELTARENVYLYGAVLGFTRKEMDSRFDEIIQFAELEKFVDTQLRNFSSGMYVRLAFATAIQSNAPIFVFDEVLAVGDASFQKKCFAVFEEKLKQNKTIVFVSHNLDSVLDYSDRVILIQGGQITKEGKPEAVINYYKENLT